MGDKSKPGKDRGPTWGMWRPIVWRDVHRVEADAREAMHTRGFRPADTEFTGGPCKDRAYYQELFKRVMKAVKETERYTRRVDGRVDAAFLSLHSAEVDLVDLLTDDQLRGRVPEVLGLARTFLPWDDERRVDFERRWDPPEHLPLAHAGPTRAVITQRKRSLNPLRWHRRRKPAPAEAAADQINHALQVLRIEALTAEVTAEDREKFTRTLRAAYRKSDIAQRRVRQLRNLLAGTVLGLAIVLGALMWVGTSSPDTLPMCAEVQSPTTLASGSPQAADDGPDPTVTVTVANTATVTATATTTATATVTRSIDVPPPPRETPAPTPSDSAPEARICATGNAEPTSGDVPLVELLGATGAALSAGYSLARLRQATTAYALKGWQAVVKVTFGAMTAFLGVLFLQAGFLTSLVHASQPLLLSYAVIFGYGQQLITRFLDKKASHLAAEAPLTSSFGPAKQEESEAEG